MRGQGVGESVSMGHGVEALRVYKIALGRFGTGVVEEEECKMDRGNSPDCGKS